MIIEFCIDTRIDFENGVPARTTYSEDSDVARDREAELRPLKE